MLSPKLIIRKKKRKKKVVYTILSKMNYWAKQSNNSLTDMDVVNSVFNLVEDSMKSSLKKSHETIKTLVEYLKSFK